MAKSIRQVRKFRLEMSNKVLQRTHKPMERGPEDPFFYCTVKHKRKSDNDRQHLVQAYTTGSENSAWKIVRCGFWGERTTSKLSLLVQIFLPSSGCTFQIVRGPAQIVNELAAKLTKKNHHRKRPRKWIKSAPQSPLIKMICSANHGVSTFSCILPTIRTQTNNKVASSVFNSSKFCSARRTQVKSRDQNGGK